MVAIYMVAALMGTADVPKLRDLVACRFCIVRFAMYFASGKSYLALVTLLDDARIWYLQVRRGDFTVVLPGFYYIGDFVVNEFTRISCIGDFVACDFTAIRCIGGSVVNGIFMTFVFRQLCLGAQLRDEV